MPARRFDNAQREQMAALREAGRSYEQIAREFSCSPSTVYWICLGQGAEPPKPAPLRPFGVGPAVSMRNGRPVRRYTPEEDEQLLALEAEGLSETEIGRRLGRRFNSVRARLMTLARREARAEGAA